MAKDIVFVLHGIGKYDKDWLSEDTGAVNALKEASEQYAFFKNQSIDTYVEFVPVLYDDVFRRIMSHWASQAEGLKNSIPVLPELASEVLDFVSDLDEDDWEKTFAADVVLYRGFRLFQQRVSLRVIKQIVDKVVETATTGDVVPDYHILAHSLGTAVANDALCHLGNESWINGLAARHAAETNPEIRDEQEDILHTFERMKEEWDVVNPFSPTLFTFESVTMISNVSEFIYATEKPERTIVRPGTSSAQGAYAKTYINANHVADPVSIATDFNPPADWELTDRFRDLKFTHFLPNDDLSGAADIGAWIHCASHYMAHPNLHLRLLSKYVNPYVPSEDDMKSLNAFPRKYGPSSIEAPFKAGYDKLKSKDISGLDDIINAIDKLKEVLDV